MYDCMQLERGAEAEQKLVLKSVRRQISSETYPEFRRGYLLVSHPAHGTLIIRNSSHDFGRDRLLEVAYWSRKAIGRDWSKRDLLELDQEFLDTNFKSVFSNKLGSRRVEVDRSIEFLLDETEGIIQAYDTWKFATGIDTAWQELGSDAVLTGAHISNGFPYVVERLKLSLIHI